MLGNILLIHFSAFIVNPGTITSLPASILSTAYFATYSLDKELKPNFTPATLLKLVFTGPGQRTLTFTLDFSFFSYLFTALDKATT